MSKPIVLVTGATGTQGGAVVSELLKTGRWTIRALTRNTTGGKAQSLQSKGVELVQGDLGDIPSLDTALKGVHSAFLVTLPNGPGGTEQETKEGIHFVDAAKRANINHLVFTSVDAAGRADVPHFHSKFKVEEHLRASGVPFTILSPVAFMDNFTGTTAATRFATLGVFAAALKGKKIQLVASFDIAWFAAKAINEPEQYKGRQISLAGDEVSMDDILNAFERVEGAKPWKAPVPEVGLKAMPYDQQKMMEFFYNSGYHVNIAELKKTHPGLLNFEGYLEKFKAENGGKLTA